MLADAERDLHEAEHRIRLAKDKASLAKATQEAKRARQMHGLQSWLPQRSVR